MIKKDVKRVIKACIILHNMIIENERGQNLGEDYIPHSAPPPSARADVSFTEINSDDFSAISDAPIHDQLQKDLVDHLWLKFGDEETGRG
jgi:hypothetical protein